MVEMPLEYHFRYTSLCSCDDHDHTRIFHILHDTAIARKLKPGSHYIVSCKILDSNWLNCAVFVWYATKYTVFYFYQYVTKVTKRYHIVEHIQLRVITHCNNYLIHFTKQTGKKKLKLKHTRNNDQRTRFLNFNSFSI